VKLPVRPFVTKLSAPEAVSLVKLHVYFRRPFKRRTSG